MRYPEETRKGNMWRALDTGWDGTRINGILKEVVSGRNEKRVGENDEVEEVMEYVAPL